MHPGRRAEATAWAREREHMGTSRTGTMRRKTEARTGKGTDGEVGDRQETVWNGGSVRTRG